MRFREQVVGSHLEVARPKSRWQLALTFSSRKVVSLKLTDNLQSQRPTTSQVVDKLWVDNSSRRKGESKLSMSFGSS
ncbi:hypothetical protein Y032_0020g9 [Ancylostoma ceylanicum]|uniref:Uncharacterized protein n=1 Tax=Ancylostoma ceylanicum TaxID=53326 RepID=A0A016V1Z4_9BILA|nr:hypothetical protein Y032_0020g9 [Ancylostoma ceylanicum]